MKASKRILSVILAVMMLFSAVPFATVSATNTTEYQVGDIIQFGSYPQTEVTDETLIYMLNNLAPEWGDWTSYGYYSGNGNIGSMVQGDWMRYTDVSYNGNKYRGMKFTQYRPDYTYSSFSNNTYQDDNGYYINTVYWFKYEPIAWRVLEPNTGLVMSETILDSQPYNNYILESGVDKYGHSTYWGDSSKTYYANNYAESSIRQWLNNDFYNTAFSKTQQDMLKSTTLDNSAFSYYYRLYDSAPTSDKIFLLSYNEVRNSNFGFDPSASVCDTVRFGQGSDYARSQGLYVSRNSNNTYNGNSSWLLRSPGYKSDLCCLGGIHGNADSGYSYGVSDTTEGVRPALMLNKLTIKTDNIYNLGEETYSFKNFGDSDSFNGHCFGMSSTSSGYYLSELDIEIIGADSSKELFTFAKTTTVKKPICHYQRIQGSYALYATVAGGSTYKIGIPDIKSDWNEVVDYVNDHSYDNKGMLQIGFRKGSGGHAINFLRYEEINGQERIYAYDNNFPDIETYFYKSTDGKIYQMPESTFSGSIDCIALRDMTKYFDCAGKYDENLVFYAEKGQIDIEGASVYPMETDSVNGEYLMYELPAKTKQATITPLVDNANFIYVNNEYGFGKIDDDTYGVFTLSTLGEGSTEQTPTLNIVNEPDPADDCSCNCHKDGIVKFFFNIILFFQKLFGMNEECSCGIKHY